MPDYVQAYLRNSRNNMNTFLNTGKGWVKRPEYNLPDVLYGDWGDLKSIAVLIDINGNGLPDYVKSYRKHGRNHNEVRLNCAQKLPDYLIAITDGFGSTLAIDYEPLSGKKVNVYTKEHDAKYPVTDWQGPMYVVYQTSSDAAIQTRINKRTFY